MGPAWDLRDPRGTCGTRAGPAWPRVSKNRLKTVEKNLFWTCFACLRHLSVGKSVAHSFAVTRSEQLCFSHGESWKRNLFLSFLLFSETRRSLFVGWLCPARLSVGWFVGCFGTIVNGSSQFCFHRDHSRMSKRHQEPALVFRELKPKCCFVLTRFQVFEVQGTEFWKPQAALGFGSSHTDSEEQCLEKCECPLCLGTVTVLSACPWRPLGVTKGPRKLTW